MNLRKDHLHDVYPNFKPESYCESLFTELTRGQLEAAAFYTWLRPGAMCQPQLQTFSNFFFLCGFFNPFTTFSDGCLGSNIDEGRSKMRYAPWMAEFRESRECWTHTALLGYSWEYVYFRTRTLKCFQGILQGSCRASWGMRRCVSVFRTSVPLTYEIQGFFKSKLSLRLVLSQQFGGKLIWFAKAVKASRE